MPTTTPATDQLLEQLAGELAASDDERSELLYMIARLGWRNLPANDRRWQIAAWILSFGESYEITVDGKLEEVPHFNDDAPTRAVHEAVLDYLEDVLGAIEYPDTADVAAESARWLNNVTRAWAASHADAAGEDD